MVSLIQTGRKKRNRPNLSRVLITGKRLGERISGINQHHPFWSLLDELQIWIQFCLIIFIWKLENIVNKTKDFYFENKFPSWTLLFIYFLNGVVLKCLQRRQTPLNKKIVAVLTSGMIFNFSTNDYIMCKLLGEKNDTLLSFAYCFSITRNQDRISELKQWENFNAE